MTSTTARVCAAATAVALGLGLAGCHMPVMTSVDQAREQLSSKAAHTNIEGLHTPGTLTVGLKNSSTAPLVIESQSRLSGMEVELACALADELGLNIAFERVVDPAEALNQTCDIVMDVGGTSDAYQVVGNIADSAVALFHKGPQGVATIDELKGKNVALQDGSASQVLLRTTDLQVKEVPADSLDHAFSLLETGGADYVLCHPMSGAYLSTRHQGIEFDGTLNDPASTGLAVAPGDGEVQTAVRDAYEKLKESGVLNETRRRWLGDIPHLGEEHQVANIPMHQTEGQALEVSYDAEQVDSGKLDGSSAGANAASISTFGQQQPNSETPQPTEWGTNVM
ncbi:MAG: transporter substrate-binding domain-containing protein [Coriobacteriales bacterium]|nr:transporter substrate-binding domain-containing protein [Coriobacteriales bacterium]